jgi:hypothetical protein
VCHTLAQTNGGFWWLDKQLVDKAKEARENGDVKAKVVNDVSVCLFYETDIWSNNAPHFRKQKS